jgi:putative oxygen-independent coproporphyrinogen III oxidase
VQFGLYLHWPFCESKCPYCDFNSHVAAKIDHDDWKAAYLAELERVAAELPDLTLSTIYFGGGTPSLMDPATVGAILDRASRLWRLANDVEVTLEANPGSVETARMQGFRAAGVNRTSLGVQALNDADLRRLGRKHSLADAMAALKVASATFDRFSFDLIYARQNQTLADWQAELAQALDMAGDHLSLYQLTVEDGTVFAERHARGQLRGLPDEDLAADMFDLTYDMCTQAGLRRYEVSNHARAGGESRHNLIYWRGAPYVGIGPGAHGRHPHRKGRIATIGHRAPVTWLQAVRNGNGEVERDVLTAQMAAEERLLMGLRLEEGIAIADIGLPCDSPVIPRGIAEGWLWSRKDRIGVTTGGVPVLNRVITEIAVEIR